MNVTTIGTLGCPATGTPAPSYLGAAAWRTRQMHGAEFVLSLLVTDIPVNKPSYVSASERCP